MNSTRNTNHGEGAPVEKADFYFGAPQAGEYLGTASDAHPDQLDVWTTFQSLTEHQFTEDDYRQIVTELVDVTEWPHKYDSSSGTPWAYCWMPPAEVNGHWKTGILVVHYFGRKMAEINSNLFHVPPGVRADTPRMRSGVLFGSQRRKADIS